MYRKLRRCLLYFRRDRCLFTLDRDVLFKIIYIPYVHVDIKITKDSDQPTVFKYLITLFIQKHRHQFKTILTEKEYKIKIL
jgi:hypothetical protein